jgi:hypothetical protein
MLLYTRIVRQHHWLDAISQQARKGSFSYCSLFAVNLLLRRELPLFLIEGWHIDIEAEASKCLQGQHDVQITT